MLTYIIYNTVFVQKGYGYMNILAIETSCDETAASVVRDGREVLSDVIASSAELHKKYGGVVPELASRKHMEYINTVIDEAVETSGLSFSDIDAVAVTYGPGLIGALLVGVSAAKALAFSLKKPLIPVHHIMAHIAHLLIVANRLIDHLDTRIQTAHKHTQQQVDRQWQVTEHQRSHSHVRLLDIDTINVMIQINRCEDNHYRHNRQCGIGQILTSKQESLDNPPIVD